MQALIKWQCGWFQGRTLLARTVKMGPLTFSQVVACAACIARSIGGNPNGLDSSADKLLTRM